MDRVNCWCQCISLASVVNASGAGCTLGSLNLLSDQAHVRILDQSGIAGIAERFVRECQSLGSRLSCRSG